MAKCAFPPCKVEIASGGDNSPPFFCEKHLAVKCVYPPCQEKVIPNSGFCQEHNDMTNFFDFVHTDRHMRAAQQQMAAQQAQVVLRKAGFGGDGKGNVSKLRP